MPARIYIETTIPSYLASRKSKDIVTAGKQETTREWWKSRRSLFSLFVSPLVFEEVALGDPQVAATRLALIDELPVLAIDSKVTVIAEAILAAGALPEIATTDASHIAVATRHGMDFLLTWNCAHIANAQILRYIAQVVAHIGYQLPVICTPDELMGENDE